MEEKFLIGTYSKDGIYKLDFKDKELSQVQKNSSFENCSYLCISRDKIYSIVEYSNISKYQKGCISSRNVNLDVINTCFLKGEGPCFIKLDESRNLLYVANYGDGSIDVFSLKTDGSINKLIYNKNFSKLKNNLKSRIHYIDLSNDKQVLFISDLGTSILYAYKIIYNDDSFDLEELSYYQFPDNSGCRHLVINNDNLYIVTENSCELYHLSFSEKNGFSLLDNISILPKNYIKKENDTGCAIRLSNDFQYIYTNIRGHNSISVFKTYPKLELIQNISCYGEIPRDINFNISQEYLLCANQASNNISIFSRNKKTGHLLFESSYPINCPACIINL